MRSSTSASLELVHGQRVPCQAWRMPFEVSNDPNSPRLSPAQAEHS